MIRFPPRRILVAYDLSKPAGAAWRHAAALAARCGAVLELAYVEPWLPEAAAGPGGAFGPSPRLTPRRVKELRETIRAKVGDGVKIVVSEGPPASGILRLARARGADMIVVGTHGRRGLSRIIMGSVAEEIVRSSHVPVLVARGRPGEIKRILAPVHFTSYSNHGFAYAAGVAERLKARLTALHVNLDPIWGGNALMRVRRLVESAPAGARCESSVVVDDDAAHGIKRASAKHDLIVLVAHKRSAIEDVLIGTTAERVLRTSRKPLLLVPPPVRRARGVLSAGRTEAMS